MSILVFYDKLCLLHTCVKYLIRLFYRIRSGKHSEIFISNMEICLFGQVRKKLSSSKSIEWFGNDGMARTHWKPKKRDLLVSMQSHLMENRTTRCLKTSFRSVVIIISEIKTIQFSMLRASASGLPSFQGNIKCGVSILIPPAG